MKVICLFTILFISTLLQAQEPDFREETINQIQKDRKDIFFYNGNKTKWPRYNYSPNPVFFDVKVQEIIDTTVEPYYKFSSDGGSIFGYCGDIVGGIKNLLQAGYQLTPHVRFLNEPKETRYVLFYGQGENLRGEKKHDEPTCDKKKLYIDGREIILKIMATQFGFSLKESEDSLEHIELIVIDTAKLFSHRTPQGGCRLGGYSITDSITNTVTQKCGWMTSIIYYLSHGLNTYADDETNIHTHGIYFDYKLPLDLFTSQEKLPELKTYLEENLGLSLRKTKKLETVYTIKFLD